MMGWQPIFLSPLFLQMDASLNSSQTPESPPPTAAAILKFAIPVILLNCTFVLMQATDAWIAGQFGTAFLAALTRPSMAIFVLVSAGYAFLSVVTAFVGQALGRGEHSACGKHAWFGLYAAAIGGITCMVLWPLAPALFRPIEHASGSSIAEIEYFQISLFSLVPILCVNAIANFYFGVKEVAAVVIVSFIGLAANLFLSLGLAFGRFGLPHWGFAGIAWGTVFASILEAVLLAGAFFGARTNKRFGTRKPPRKLRAMAPLLKTGGPAAVQGGVDVLSWGVLLAYLVSFYGATELAAATILLRCMQFTFLPAEGIATVVVSMVANSIGEGKPRSAVQVTAISFKINAVFMILCGLLFYILRRPIAEIYSSDPAVVTMVSSLMVFVSFAQWFDAMNITHLHALQGAGDTRWPSLMNLFLSIFILGFGGWLSVTFLKDKGVALIWFLAWLYIACQGVAFLIRWKSSKWLEADLAES